MHTILFFLSSLVAMVTFTHARSFTTPEKRLIKFTGDRISWLDEDGVNSLIRNQVQFMDITNKSFPKEKHALPKLTGIPSSIRFQSTVSKVLTNLSILRMETFLTHFSSYHNRYYASPTGIESAEWLLAQKSIIARIYGSDPVLKHEVVILGAHLDSINSTHPADGLAQGADDNGSGSTVLLEAWRLLLTAGFIPKRSIEFHWYAAEEVGLRGSLDIAEKYFHEKVKVVSMVNFDVLGYYVEDRDEVALYTDYANPELLAFMELVVGSYLDFGFFYRACGSRCSDHVSWHEYGFPALFNKEAVSNPYMHTTNDKLELVNFIQVAEFVKLAVGYAVEVAEPNE